MNRTSTLIDRTPGRLSTAGPSAIRSTAVRLTALAAATLAATVVGCKPEAPAPPATNPAPPAATAPSATRAAKPIVRDWSYLDVVRAAHPAATAAQPLSAPLALNEAARVFLDDPAYVDEQGHLWITKAGQAPTESVLKAAGDGAAEEHVVGDRVAFAWWVRDKGDTSTPYLVVPTTTAATKATAASSATAAGDTRPAGAGAFELVGPNRRQPIGRRSDYRWARGRSWSDGRADRLAVPTATGVAVFTFRGPREPVVEAYHDFAVAGDADPAGATRPTTGPTTTASTGPSTRPQPATGPASAPPVEPLVLFAPGGVLAWVPPPPTSPAAVTPDGKPAEAMPADDKAADEKKASGDKPADVPAGGGVARFVDGAWKVLPAADGWPAHPLHLIPLRDGSVFELLADDPGVKLAFTALPAAGGSSAAGAAPAVDPKVVLALLDKLADDDVKVREAAFAELTNFGPGLLTVLRVIPEADLAPQARAAVRGLLRQQATPMLGGLGVRGEHLRVVRRLRDGGVLLYTADGVALPNPDGDEPLRVAPAWVAARPGRAVEILPQALTQDVPPERPDVDVVGGRYVVTTDASGPRLFAAGLFRTLLKKDDAEYSHVVAVDRKGRWLLRKPADAKADEAGTPGTADRPVRTLIVDPTLPNFTPRLPVWVYDNAPPDPQPNVNAPPAAANESAVGWDKEGWPAVRQGGVELRLLETGWSGLAEGSPLIADPPPEPALPSRPTTAPASAPASAPTTATATAPASAPADDGPPLFVDAKGTRYYDGTERLSAVAADGRRTDWTLPGTSVGQSPARLVGTADGLLFLFNQPGRVLRIRPTPDAPEPFAIEKAFTRNIPSGETPKRTWLDPAGRIILAMDHKLVILFPSGYIPQAIREKMSEPADEEE